MALPNDTQIYPIMAELSACLCAELAEHDEPTCFCGIIFGEEIPVGLDGEECTSAYVRLVNAFPSNSFPQPDDGASCATSMAYVLAVGIVRPMLILEDNELPSEASLIEEARVALADMAAIRRAIRCCLTDEKFEDLQYVLGQFTPAGQGLRGGEFAVTIGPS